MKPGGTALQPERVPGREAFGRPPVRLGINELRKAKGFIMRYEVRYLVGGDEHTIEVDADDAASAASLAQEQYLDSSDTFELIQVHLLDEMPDQLESAAPSAS